MFKLVSILAVLFAIAAAHPNPEKMKADMTAAGVSAAGVSTISVFMESHKPQKGGNREQGKAEFEAMLATLTESDRNAFKKVMESHRPKGGQKH